MKKEISLQGEVSFYNFLSQDLTNGERFPQFPRPGSLTVLRADLLCLVKAPDKKTDRTFL